MALTANAVTADTKPAFDTILHNGMIYAGDGQAPIRGDLGIKDGKIAALGQLGTDAPVRLDVQGQAISPGFIDIHGHTDTNLFQAPKGDSRIFQGITTEIGGNCGGSPFPVAPYKTAATFFDDLKKQGIGINYGTLIGQGSIRSAIIGDHADPATPETLGKMKELVDALLEQGCVGLSFGLEYAPGCYATDEELTELLKVVAHRNALFAIHMRNEDDRVEQSVAEAIAMARKSGARLQISHLKAQNANNWHRAPALLRQIEAARASGLDLAFDRYPYVAFSNGLNSFIPLLDRQGTDAEVLARLKDDTSAERIREYAEDRLKRLGGPTHVLIISARREEYKPCIGKNIEECAKMFGLQPWPFIRKMLVDEQLFPEIVAFAMSEDNVKQFLAHPLGMPASDGSVYSPEGPLGEMQPHPRSYGTFPRFFGKYVREEKICDLATAVHKATGLPASRLHLRNRGLLKPGYQADIVVFDPATILDRAVFDAPHQFPIGIPHVFVNGVWTIRDGKHTGALPGEIVRLA